MTVTTNSLLGLGAVISAIFAFYTGTLGVIFSLMYTQYQAFVFVVGFVAVLIVVFLPLFMRTRLRDVHGRNAAAAMIICLLVIPFVVQGQYNPSALDVYGSSDHVIADTATWFYYMNTSGYYLSASMTETQDGNGTWDSALVSTAQDNDLQAEIKVWFPQTASGADDKYNVTAFDSDTDDHIVAIGVRIMGADAGIPIQWCMGFDHDVNRFHSYSDSPILTSETELTMIYLTLADYAYFDDYVIELATDSLNLRFRELDASQFVNAATVEIEVHFYIETSMASFNEYLLYTGVIMCLMALAMTPYWNPSGKKRHRRRYRSRSRYRGRGRYRGRRRY